MTTPNGYRPVVCHRCGQEHRHARTGRPSCAGHVDKPDEPLRPCGNLPCLGLWVCGSHGARAPQVKAAAARRLAEERARKVMATYGKPIDGHWSEALANELRWSLGHVQWLRDQVQGVDRDALVWGIVDELNKGSGEFPGVDLRKAAAPSAWLELYHRERRYLLDVIKAMGSTEALDRQIRLAERQGAQMYAVFGRVHAALLDALDLTPEQRALADALQPSLLEREVRALTGPAVIEGSAT